MKTIEEALAAKYNIESNLLSTLKGFEWDYRMQINSIDIWHTERMGKGNEIVQIRINACLSEK